MVKVSEPISIFWFRRDLRLEDNAGLYHALKDARVPVLPIFIFDTNILDRLEDRDDARVMFIHDTISDLKQRLEVLGSTLQVEYGDPLKVWAKLLDEYKISAVYTNRDYEPYAKTRDKQVESLLKEQDCDFWTYKDHVIFEHGEVIKGDGDPYVVYTPYKRTWYKKLESRPDPIHTSFYFKPYPSEDYVDNLLQVRGSSMPTLDEIGFRRSSIEIPAPEVNQKTIRLYDEQRDFPAINGTSRLGIHFRFGTISIRQKAAKAFELNKTYLSELIWRDFYAQILAHYPHVVNGAFRAKYDAIEWRNNEDEFAAWCEGRTGYPMVDAGMRELNATGFMHNRVRMVVASFLTKHLLIDWRWGEAYFARLLLDFDLASNNGGWQWAAGCGTDAAPYFRIFNPESQMKKFDKKLNYIKEWVPELGTERYPDPIVEHKFARERCLRTYKEALN